MSRAKTSRPQLPEHLQQAVCRLKAQGKDKEFVSMIFGAVPERAPYRAAAVSFFRKVTKTQMRQFMDDMEATVAERQLRVEEQRSRHLARVAAIEAAKNKTEAVPEQEQTPAAPKRKKVADLAVTRFIRVATRLGHSPDAIARAIHDAIGEEVHPSTLALQVKRIDSIPDDVSAEAIEAVNSLF